MEKYFDIRNNHTVNPVRFRCALTGETVCMEITPSFFNFKKDITIENSVRLETNTIDTHDDENHLVFKRNNAEHMLFSSGKVEISQPCHFNGSWVFRRSQLNQL